VEPFQRFEPDLNDDLFRQFQDLINSWSGIVLDESHRDTLRIGLVARATAINLKTYDQYYHYLKLHPNREAEFRGLISLLAVSETSFFRNREQFDILRTHILQDLFKSRLGQERAIRIWSAGCSVGAEPYSIAMTLLDSIDQIGNCRIDILATDVSQRSLKEAMEGSYSERFLRFCTTMERARHFTKTKGGRYVVNERVRSMVQFRYFNLVEEPFPLSIMGRDILPECDHLF
jgi:chemotaxis protein methyltransferase CheR